VGGLFWLWHLWPRQLRPSKGEASAAVEASNIPSITTPTVSNAPSQYPPKPSGLTEDAWARMVWYFERTKARNSPIEYYARAVDQDQNPVAGATLSLEVTRFDERWLFRPDLKKVTDDDLLVHQEVKQVSDRDGRFSYSEGKGIGVDVMNVETDGYLWERPQTM
jgi:hypothetical protein